MPGTCYGKRLKLSKVVWVLPQGQWFHLAVTSRGCCPSLSLGAKHAYMWAYGSEFAIALFYKCILTIFICREKFVCWEASCWGLRTYSHHLHVLGINSSASTSMGVSLANEKVGNQHFNIQISIVLFIFTAGLFYCSKHERGKFPGPIPSHILIPHP